MRCRPRKGFSIIELLVVIGLIGVLLSLLIPAVQSSREASRRLSCASNLRQQGTAMLSHEAAFGRLPSNGWGWKWAGHPDRGTDRRQPGGWIYNILAYVDQVPLRELGKGKPPAEQRKALAGLIQTPLAVFLCPSRRRAEVYPHVGALVPYNSDPVSFGGKTDYAVCEGDFITQTGPGPATLAEGDSPTYQWTDVRRATGICFLRSEIRLAQIADGTGQTYMIGEKYVDAARYETGDDLGDDQNLYLGVDWDINRWARPELTPYRDQRDFSDPRTFGSAHPSVCNFAFCDGSVRGIKYTVDGEVHRRLGNRKDQRPVDMGALE
jgi:prepilin-type N-terminal cleavage/methylation domain-containing protein/prepilin-type processing-associated H-X9-DG protein